MFESRLGYPKKEITLLTYGGKCLILDLRILLIDDNDEIREVMSVYCDLEKDIDCQIVNTGQKGLERMRNEKFDLILLDIAMPEFNGLDVIESLKKDGLLESKNVVIFTASSNQKLFNEMKNTGVKEVFKKPFSLEELTGLIEKYRPKTLNSEQD